MAKAVLRRCIACRKVSPKGELIRIAVNKADGLVEVDESGKGQSRGAYLHRKIECLVKANSQAFIERALKSGSSALGKQGPLGKDCFDNFFQKLKELIRQSGASDEKSRNLSGRATKKGNVRL